MRVDLHRVETALKERERDVARLRESLNGALDKFQEALEYRRGLRERLAGMVEKVSRRMEETGEVVRAIDRKRDRAERVLAMNREELKDLEKDEKIAKGKYNELLMGRVPPRPGGAAVTATDNGADLSKMKSEFFERIENAFHDLENEISGLKSRGDNLRAQVDEDTKRVKLYGEKKKILSKTLALYKSDLKKHEKRLAETIEEEERLMEEFTDFLERLDSVAAIPATVRDALEKNLQQAREGGVTEQ